jgi:hypothetical protein
MAGKTTNGIYDTIGTDLLRPVEPHINTDLAGGIADHHRFAMKMVAAQFGEMKIGFRHHTRNDRGFNDTWIKTGLFHERAKENGIFIRSTLHLGRMAPDGFYLLAFEKGENDIGIAGIYSEKHF